MSRSPKKTEKSDFGDGGLIQPLAVVPLAFPVGLESVVGLVPLALEVSVGLVQPCLRWCSSNRWCKRKLLRSSRRSDGLSHWKVFGSAPMGV